MTKEAKLKRIQQLTQVGNLYNCEMKCLKAITYIIENDLLESEKAQELFDCSRKCQVSTIREFICETLPELSNCCVCANLEDKIKEMNVVSSLTVVDCDKVK